MTNIEQDQLEDEVRWSNHAKSAYESYLKQFIEKQRQYCYDQFAEISCNNVNDIQTIKYLLDSINHLENSIRGDMETGKLARIQLEGKNDGRFN